MRGLPGRGRASGPSQVLGTPSGCSSLFGLEFTNFLSFFPPFCLFLFWGAGSLVTQAGLEFSV